ncbi:MAG: alpha-1,2-fucosyltransferase [Planctomycetaceae bacterium]
MSSVVVTGLAGGLGNQLYQYAAGRVAALRKGARLRLDCSFYRFREDRAYALSHFQIEHEDFLSRAEARLLQYWFGTRHRRLKSLARAAFGDRLFSRVVDPMSRVTPELLHASGNLYLSGYWQSPAYFDGEEELIRREFRFRMPPEGRIASLIDRMASCESVAVHVRRGDYVSDAGANKVHGICKADYYDRAAEIVCGRVASPRFFVFSDDPAAARRELRLPGPTEFVEENVGRRDWDDLRLMSSCRHHIIANSSFSWWGAWLAKHDGQAVVAPKQWFSQAQMSGHRLEDRFPAEWIAT